MKTSILFVFLVSIHSLAFSQKNSFSGYYVGINGDTVHGAFPAFKQTDRNPAEAKFITTDNKNITLTVQNCILFDVKDVDRYVAYDGLRMTNPIDESGAGIAPIQNTYDTIHAFLKVIYQGNDVTLYSYADKQRENYFYKKRGTEIIELEKKVQTNTAGDSRQFITDNRFRNQLKEAFALQIENKKLQTQLSKLNYSERELVRFMNSLSETGLPAKINKYPARLIIGAGAAFNSLAISGDPNYKETQIEHQSPVSPVFVVGARFSTKRSNGRLLISPTIRVYSFSAEGDVDLTSGLATYNQATDFRSKLIITPSANLGYAIISQPVLKWYVSAGFGYAFLLKSKEVQTTTYTNAPPTIIDYNPLNMIFVVNAETGVDIGKNLSVWLNYQPPANTSRVLNKAVKFSSLQAGVSWLLKTGK